MQSISKRTPTLSIKSYVENDQIVVQVTDNGPGIPVEFQDKVLNTYFTTKPQGTGIGLGICRSLVEAHGGTLSVHKLKKNGASFSFALPIISQS